MGAGAFFRSSKNADVGSLANQQRIRESGARSGEAPLRCTFPCSRVHFWQIVCSWLLGAAKQQRI